MYSGNRQALVFGLNDRDGFAEVFTHVKAVGNDNNVTWDSETPARGLQAFDTGSSESDRRADAFSHPYYIRLVVDPSNATVDEMEAERIAKLLKRVRTKMDKMSADYGTPGTFGAYVQRLAKALDIAEIGFYPPKGRELWASGYRLRFDNPANAAYTIDNIITQWREQSGTYAIAS